MPPDEGQTGSFHIQEYFQILRARKWWVISIAVVVIAVALASSFVGTRRYKADALVAVEPPQVGATVNFETAKQIVASDAVTTRVKEDLGHEGEPSQLLEGLSVEALPGTEILSISYFSTDAEEARILANSFANNYVELRRNQELAKRRVASREIRDQIERTENHLRAIVRDLAAARRQGGAETREQLTTEKKIAITRIRLLQRRLVNVGPDPSIVLSMGRVIDPAATPSSPEAPDYARNATLGLVLGLVFGAAAALVREHVADRFLARRDVQSKLGLPLLGSVPRLAGENRRLALEADQASDALEAYRMVGASVRALASKEALTSIAVVSPAPGDGRTTTVANVAAALAQTGSKVVAVSSDLRAPTLEDMFGVADTPGLIDWLTIGNSDPWSFVKQTSISRLRVLPAGSLQSSRAELLYSTRFGDLIEEFEKESDFVVLDSPAALSFADAGAIGAKVDMTVLVINSETTSRSSALETTNRLKDMGARLVGVVLNGAERQAP